MSLPKLLLVCGRSLASLESEYVRIRPPLKPQDRAPTYLTDEDTQNALTLLAERRESDPEYKAPRILSKITKSRAKLEEFSNKEINRAFRAIVEENGSLGLVEAFLALGASVDVARRASTNMWKKVIKKDQTDVRNDVLQVATRGGSNQLVELLAGYADQQSRDEALLIAVYQQNLQKTQTLLEFDASIYEAHDIFLSAVDNGDTDLIELLLAAPKLPCRECRAKALVKAAATSCLRIVSALLFSDADTQYDDAQAIKLAASHGDLAVCVAIAGSPRPPSPSNLDAAAGVGYRDNPDHRTRCPPFWRSVSVVVLMMNEPIPDPRFSHRTKRARHNRATLAIRRFGGLPGRRSIVHGDFERGQFIVHGAVRSQHKCQDAWKWTRHSSRLQKAGS